MSQVALLYRLQQIDTEFTHKKERLTEVLRAQKETESLRAARQRVAETAETLQEWQSKRTNLNLELDGLNTKVKRSENRLYSGNVTNPKELSDLQSEIASLSRRRSGLEDEILDAMIMVEEVEEEQATAAGSLTQETADWELSQADLKQEQNELALRLHELTGQRQEVVTRIPAGQLRDYDQLRKNRSGMAVAGLQGNRCLGCRLTLSANTIQRAGEGQLVYCDNCGRILHPV